MQSFVRICVAIWVLAGLTLVPAPAVAAPARVPGITISPPVGTLTTTFVFTGTGFPAGMILTAAFLDPTGVPYDSYTSGQPLTVTVDGRGRFELSIVPSRDLPGAVAGRWQFEFCVATGGSQCWGETFDITAPGRPAAAPPAAVSRTAGITVSPPTGNATTTFVFTGAGFPAGMILTAAFLDPTGIQYDSYTSGQPITVTVDGRGGFEVGVVPLRDFPGSSPGRWRFEFCVATGGSDCWGETFDITR